MLQQALLLEGGLLEQALPATDMLHDQQNGHHAKKRLAHLLQMRKEWMA